MSQQHVNVRPEEVEAGGEATTAKPSLRPIGLAYESDFIDATESTMRDLMKQDYEEHNIEYGGYLCNHMFHALVALWRLGGIKIELMPPSGSRSYFISLLPHFSSSRTIEVILQILLKRPATFYGVPECHQRRKLAQLLGPEEILPRLFGVLPIGNH
jgi:hypothetical protein